MQGLKIGQVAKSSDVNLQTIRYYEREGLLPPPARLQSGYRMFPTEAVRRVRFIKRAQELGFSLKEIRELLSLQFKADTDRSQIRAIALAKLDDIDRKIDTLRAMKRILASITASCDGCGPLGDCPILDSFNLDDIDGKEVKTNGAKRR